MATGTHTPMLERASRTVDDYANCLIKPMGRGDEQLVDLRHVLDAVLVAFIVFFAVIMGELLTLLLAGEFVYLSLGDITQRLPTALMAFFLTFFAQWARARGLDAREWLVRFLE